MIGCSIIHGFAVLFLFLMFEEIPVVVRIVECLVILLLGIAGRLIQLFEEKESLMRVRDRSIIIIRSLFLI